MAGAGIVLLAQRDPSVSRGNEIPPKESGGGQPDGSLAQYIAQLQQTPDNQELREKIVQLAARAKPVPEIPEQARGHYAQARTSFEAAETINDVGKAIDAYQAALLVAPWWPDANKDLGLALEMAQRHDEAIAALRLYLAAEPGGRDAAAAEDEIRKIEAKRNKTFSMSLGIPTRCQFKVPALVSDYWLYIDGRLVSSPPHKDIRREYALVELGPDQGYEFRDKEGVAAVVNRGGKLIYERKDADVYTAETFDVEPGSHKLDYLLLNKEGFPFATASTDLEFKTGDSRGFWFNMPADYVGQSVPQAVAPFFGVPIGDWQEEFGRRQAIVKRRSGLCRRPIVQALNQAILGAAVSLPRTIRAMWVNLPAENGGKRQLDWPTRCGPCPAHRGQVRHR